MSTRTAEPPPRAAFLPALARGFRMRLPTLALIVAINTGIALVLWSNDPRPFWHPLVTTQIYGLCIAYAVNVVAPWDKPRPILLMILAIAAAVVVGVLLVIVVKGYTLEGVREHWKLFAWNVVLAFMNGLVISLLFFVKLRESRANAALHQAVAERNLLAKQAVESELKLMQAQVEPHFLFNTLASVQYLTETDPREANRLLSHLIDYLRAALPQLRASSTTLGKEVGLAEAYLNILRMRMGSRLGFTIDVSPGLATHPFPPNLLISLVENAIKHGVEPAANGGTVCVRARREASALVVTVEDTGRGLNADSPAGHGVGLANVRDRLAALYGTQGRFTLEAATPCGTCATLSIPLEPCDDDGTTAGHDRHRPSTAPVSPH